MNIRWWGGVKIIYIIGILLSIHPIKQLFFEFWNFSPIFSISAGTTITRGNTQNKNMNEHREHQNITRSYVTTIIQQFFQLQ